MLSYQKMSLSSKVKNIPEAMSVYFNQLVYELKQQNRDITTLSLGEAYFEIPNFGFENLDFTRGYHYSDSRGLLELREKIAGYYNSLYGAQIVADNILVSAGSKAIIYMCMQAALDPGEKIAIHEPAWLSYQEQARLVGAHVNFIPYHTPCSQFQDYFTDDTRMIILNNPNNPAGGTYKKEDLLMLYQQCRPRGIYMLIDEAYSDFVLDGSFTSMATLVQDLDGVIVVNSLSKNMGMSGWRIGYAIANQEFLGALLKLNQHLITCASTILQQYLATYFEDILSHTLPQVRAVVEKRNRIAQYMDKLGLRYLPGSTTFYFFVETSPYAGNIHELALHLLLKKGISVVPGSAYGATTTNFFRISIGAESEERIYQALETLQLMLNGVPVEVQRGHRELERLGMTQPSFRDFVNAAPVCPAV